MERLRIWLGRVVLVLGGLVLVACESDDGPDRVVARSVERYDGNRFENVRIRFQFRETPFEVNRNGGRFRYQRTLAGQGGRVVTEVMENDETWAELSGARLELSSDEIYELETAVNSVVYFGFLPFRLDDDAVVLRDLGPSTVDGEPYHKIEATFEQDGGGTDWDTRFVHWIHRDHATLDYLAYSYSRDGGGARFRRSVNRREVDGLTVQDYENYAADLANPDIADFDRLFELGELELLSMVELEGVEVSR